MRLAAGALIWSLLVVGVPVARAADSMYVRNKWCSRPDTLVVFASGNNVIEIYCPGHKGEDLRVKSEDSKLRIADPEVRGDTIDVWAMPYATGRRMKLSVRDSKTGKTLRELSVYGAKLPEPVAAIGNLQGPAIVRHDILNQYGMRVIFPHSLYSYPYHIASYRFRAHVGGKEITHTMNDAILAPAIMQDIKDIPANTAIEFTDIHALCKGCEMRVLPDLKYIVK